jgi:transposase, IS5 family
LDKHGYLARVGQIVDASIVPAPKQHIPKAEKVIVKEQAMPIDWSPAKRRQKNIEASWTKKHGKSYFCYKLSANTDKKYKLIRKIKISTADEHDTRHLEEVLFSENTSRALYTEIGYVHKKLEARLKAKDWQVNIQRKAAKNKALSAVRSDATHEKPKHAPELNMFLPVWNS